ncbi:MAG: cytochrome c biogenesis protein [Sandaracinaceae bacterium]|nr:cytochrome c biogenesis protein [Sandaracinaceae bacterium]
MSNKTPIGFVLMGVLVIASLPITLWTIFVHAPIEMQMGIAQKIFYFHAPCAYAMYVGFVVCGVASLVHLITRKESWEALAVAGAEVGLLFCVMVLFQGMLWARKAWGVYWTWDPRLSSTLLAALIFTSYVVLRSIGAGGAGERRFAAGLAIVGALELPLIHYSVKLWRGQHPTVLRQTGGEGLAPEMGHAFLAGFLFFTVLVIWLLWARMRLERQRQAVRALELDAMERGLLEDS